ncbi:MAG: hypothetical protein D6725_03260, partial [Planctomycetota bacterium]
MPEFPAPFCRDFEELPNSLRSGNEAGSPPGPDRHPVLAGFCEACTPRTERKVSAGTPDLVARSSLRTTGTRCRALH